MTTRYSKTLGAAVSFDSCRSINATDLHTTHYLKAQLFLLDLLRFANLEY